MEGGLVAHRLGEIDPLAQRLGRHPWRDVVLVLALSEAAAGDAGGAEAIGHGGERERGQRAGGADA